MKRERAALEEMTRSTLPYRQVVQAQGLLLAADGVAGRPNWDLLAKVTPLKSEEPAK